MCVGELPLAVDGDRLRTAVTPAAAVGLAAGFAAAPVVFDCDAGDDADDAAVDDVDTDADDPTDGWAAASDVANWSVDWAVVPDANRTSEL